MKNILKLLCNILPLIVISLQGCQKEDDVDDSRFGCYINGVKWGPYSNDFKFNPVRADRVTWSGGTTLLIAAHNQENKTEMVAFVLKDFVGEPKTYKLDLPSSSHGLVTLKDYTEYETDLSNIGQVDVVKIDTVKKQISGNFSFSAKMKNSNAFLKVNKGYFNVTYKVYYQ